jgi:hypothetical protein
MDEVDEAAIVAELAAAGRYQTPEGNYYSARLRFITADPADPVEADRALADMISWVTLTVPNPERPGPRHRLERPPGLPSFRQSRCPGSALRDGKPDIIPG